MVNKNQEILQLAIIAAIKAGKATLEYYGRKQTIKQKENNTPLTLADLASHSVISDSLRSTNIPVLSEEGNEIPYSARAGWKEYWLIDPLDGTKEFIKQSSEYTVNIAFMYGNTPETGVIYVPVTDVLYYGTIGVGAYKVTGAGKLSQDQLFSDGFTEKLPVINTQHELVLVSSKSHLDDNTEQFIEKTKLKYKAIKVEGFGSSLKLCMIAEGRADVYPRLGPTMEWDIAAGHAILASAGCKLLQYPSMGAFQYNKPDLLNPWFIAFNEKYKPES